MKLTFEPFDGRAMNYRSVIDNETNTEVGFIKSRGVGTYCSGGIEVSLFGDRYRTIVKNYQQCVGFVEGVEAVLSHMTNVRYIAPVPPRKAAQSPTLLHSPSKRVAALI